MDFPFNKDITYFAKTNFRGTDQIFGIKRKDRRQHMYVLGKSGTGKSVMLENMIIQNIHQGEGVCVVDPHGELVEKILETIPRERAQDVIYFNPADTDHNIGFNVLQLDDPRYKHLVASGLMGIFTKIWANAWSSRMEYILNNTILALLDTPDTTLLGIPRMLVDKDYRQYIINNLKDPVVKAFWVHEYEAWRDQFRNEAIAPIQNKVGQFLSSNIVRNVVGQTRSTINIFDIMNNKKIFLVNVSKGRIGEDNSALLGGMLITKLQLSAMERVRIPENQREDFYLYVDEFQNFVTDSFASILSEARKYRLNLIIAHQYIAQLETQDGSAVKDAVFGNVGTMIIFRVGADDAEHLEKEFEPEFTVEDFVNLPNYNIYTKLMVDGVTSRPFSAKTLPPVPVEISEETKNFIIDTSRKNYTRERSVVENEIQKWSSTVPGQTRPDGEETEGKFKAECSNCKKSIYVPFEPEAGRPIYCKECLFKIKNGELEATAGFRPPREKRDTISYDALASLGIEFAESRPAARTDRPAFRPAPAPVRDAAISTAPRPQAQTATTMVRPPARPLTAPASAPSRPDVPPTGIIRADSRDMPAPRTAPRPMSEAPRTAPAASPRSAQATQAEKQESSSVSLPNPRAVKMPIRKERVAPDTSALQSLLKSAIGGVMGTHKPQPAQPAIAPSEQEASAAKKPDQPTMSLSSLKDKQPVSQFMTPNKEAQPERQNMLKDAISKATGEPRSDHAEPEAPSVTVIIEKQGPSETDKAAAAAMIAAEQDRKEREEKLKKDQEELRKKIEEEQEARAAALKQMDDERKRREELEREAERMRMEKERLEADAQIERERVRQEAAARETALKEERDRLVEENARKAKEAEEIFNRRLAQEREEAIEKARVQAEEVKAKLMAELEEKEAIQKQQAQADQQALKIVEEKRMEEHQEALEREREESRIADMQSSVEEPAAVPEQKTAKPKKEVPEDLLKEILG